MNNLEVEVASRASSKLGLSKVVVIQTLLGRSAEQSDEMMHDTIVC